MAKHTYRGSAGPNHPIYSGGVEVFSRQGSKPPLKSSASAADGDTQEISNSVAGTVDPVIGLERAINKRFGAPSTSESKPG